MSGVTIGNGAVIAANSVVSKDIGSYEIWGGNPAALLKKRFSFEDIMLLEKIKWWDLPDEEIKKMIPILASGDFNSLKEMFPHINIQ